MKTNYFFSIAITAALLINCKGKDGAPGPAGTVPSVTEKSLIKEGFMRATLTTMVDGVSTVFNFDFQGNTAGEFGNYTVENPNETRIGILKRYSSDGEVYREGSMSLSFTVDNLTNLNGAKYGIFYVTASKEVGSRKVQSVAMGASVNRFTGADSDKIVITDLKYDATTSIISGKFTGMIKVFNSITAEERPITNGSFSSFIERKVFAARKSN